MSQKKDSETLAQQRKARQDFLELKMMQQGKMNSEPKPSDVAILPKTPKEKFDNFWFHNKWYVIIISIVVAAIIFVLAQCATKTKYDATVVLFTYTVTGDDNCKLMGKYLEPYCEDINGDGEVNVNVINCSLKNGDTNSEFNFAARTRAQTLLSTDASALLFITDAKSYEFLNNASSDGALFEGDPLPFADDFYEFCVTDSIYETPDNLQISCRRIEGTIIESDKNIDIYYNQAQHILENLK